MALNMPALNMKIASILIFVICDGPIFDGAYGSGTSHHKPLTCFLMKRLNLWFTVELLQIMHTNY